MNKIAEKIITDDFIKVFGNFCYEKPFVTVNLNEIKAETSKYFVEAICNCDAMGVNRLTGKLTAKDNMEISCFDLQLEFGGGEYEVYTQYNGWQNESRGNWHTLNTGIFVEGRFSRTSSGVNPFMSVWNKQTNRGIAFHLLPVFAWEMKAYEKPAFGENVDTVVEIGVNKENLRINLKKGESVENSRYNFLRIYK